MIRVGTAGWHYEDWNGFVYPRPRPHGFDPLEALAEIFDAIEVNVTFYRAPDPAMTATWVRRVASNPAFRFTVKAPRTFTHERGADLASEEARFRRALAPIKEADRLGAVLVQFPQSFHRTPQAAEHLDALIERFADLPLVAEFRHAGWGDEGGARGLRERGVGFCNIDQPRLGGTLGPTAYVTGPIAYVRLHGRNAEEWFREGGDPASRYDYLYSARELGPWIVRVRQIAEQGADTYVIANNHFRGKAAVNALQIKAALAGARVQVPDTLLSAYPELAPIALPSPGRLPFSDQD